jgi:hypothetical protein
VTAELRWLDADGNELTLDAGHAADLGGVPPGASSRAAQVRLRNAGDVAVDFVLARAAPHPSAQAGPLEASALATRFALAEDGAYAACLDLGTLRPGEERSLWVRWDVPPDAAPRSAVWALEAVGAPREGP